jgi:hypothetical protein
MQIGFVLTFKMLRWKYLLIGVETFSISLSNHARKERNNKAETQNCFIAHQASLFFFVQAFSV